MKRLLLASIVAFALISTPTSAGVLLNPVPAPEWHVEEWINGTPGRLGEHTGRVILIDFFQLWCPGCNEFSIPLFQRWDRQYGTRDDVLIVSIHTVFEGHDYQTPERLRAFVAENDFRHPVGIDQYDDNDSDTPMTMKRYETGGTPHVVIIDKHGRIVFSHFGRFDVAPVEAFIDRLLKEKAPAPTKKKPAMDTTLSGRYQFRFEATAATCGTVPPPRDVVGDVTVIDNRIQAVFTDEYLGQRLVSISMNATTGLFQGQQRRQATDGGDNLNLQLQVNGRFTDRSADPVLEFQFSLTSRNSADPGRTCRTQGRGEARRISF